MTVVATITNPDKPDFATEVRSSFLTVNPQELVLPKFDSRAANGILDDAFLTSIKADGIMNPVLVAPLNETDAAGNPKYMVIAGRRRVRGAMAVGLTSVPCHVKPMDYKSALLAAFNENEQRLPMTTWDRATAFKALRDTGLKQTQIAASIGKSDAYVSRHLMVFELDVRVQELVKQAKFEPNAIAKIAELRNITDGDTQYQIAKKATEDQERPWRAEDIREAIERLTGEKVQPKKRSSAKVDNSPAIEETTNVEPLSAVEDVAGVDDVDDYYDRTSIKVVAHDTVRRVLEAQHRRVQSLRADPAANAMDLIYQRGVLDGYERFAGVQKIAE